MPEPSLHPASAPRSQHHAVPVSSGARRLAQDGVGLAVSLLLLAVIWWPFLSRQTFPAGGPDWRARAHYASYTVTALFGHGEIPFWAASPRYHQMWMRNGRHGFFSNPETEVFSPYVALYAATGFGAAVRISLVLHAIIGVVGLHLLLRSRGVRHPVILPLSAVLLFGSGFFVRHILAGHLQFASFAYLPLALWLYLRSLADARFGRTAWRDLFACGLLLAAAYYEGSVHLALQFLFLLGVLTTWSTLGASGRRWQTAARFPAILMAFVLLAGFKLFPGIAEYGGYRPPGLATYAGVAELLDYVWTAMPATTPPIPHHELSLYVGVAGAIWLAVGLGYLRRSSAALMATVWVLLLLVLPPFGGWLEHVPVLSTQRPTRLRGQVLVLAVVLSGEAVARAGQVCARRWSSRGATRLVTLVSLVVLGLVVRDEAAHFRAVMAEAPGRESIALREPDLAPPLSRLVPPRVGTVRVESHGPNAFSVIYAGDARADHPALIVLPTIAAEEGAATLEVEGARRTDHEGQMGLLVSRSPARVEIRYSSTYATVGGVGTVVGLAVFLWLMAVARRGQPPSLLDGGLADARSQPPV